MSGIEMLPRNYSASTLSRAEKTVCDNSKMSVV